MSILPGPSLAPVELVELADLNLAESFREHARWNAVGIVDEREDTLRTLGATRFAAGMFNTVVRTGPGPSDPLSWLAAQRAYFSAYQRGFSVYLRGARDADLAPACSALGMTLADTSPGMACDAPLPVPPLDPSIELEQVETLTSMHKLIAVMASAYVSLGLPEGVTHKIFGEPERLLRPHLAWFLARHEGAPAATAMVLFSHSIAGVYWVATRPELRGLGLGEACTRAATNAAFARGARAVILQASRMGYRIYERMGYRTITSYPWYLSPRQ